MDKKDRTTGEEELSLTGPAPKEKPTQAKSDLKEEKSEETPDDAQPETPRMGAKFAHLDIAPGASDLDVLATVMSTPEEKLYVWELCQLPSRGIYYGWVDGTIEIRPMTQTAEKILANQRMASTGESFDYLLRECCRFPNGFDPVNLLVGDRTFLMFYLRGITHGNIYEFAVPCPNQECGQTTTHRYDLNNLAKTVRWADQSLGVEPFKVSLPYFSQLTGRDFWVSLRFMRGTDSNTMVARYRQRQSNKVRSGGIRNPLARRREQSKERMELDNTITDSLQQMIVNVMGDSRQSVISDIVSKLHATDSATIREWMRVNTPGVDASVIIPCPECEREFTVELPMTEAFFRPTGNVPK